jgi:acetoacetyl-CoA synthetase
MISWRPDPERRRASVMARFLDARRREGAPLPEVDAPEAFGELHAWSVANPGAFWEAIWNDLGVIGDRGDGPALVGAEPIRPPDDVGPGWFPTSRLNFAENLLQHRGDAPAILAWDERGAVGQLSRDELRSQVARVAHAFLAMGVAEGDRVAGWLPNIPEAVVAALATASIGATWTSCSPDFGVDGIVDRFGQTEPVVLIFADGYRYAGKLHDCTERAAELRSRLPSVRHAVMVHHLGEAGGGAAGVTTWTELLASTEGSDPPYRRLPFDHPLYILYSSGTTGLPKCLVHGAGGTLLQHLKEHRLHLDLSPDERLFYFTTCGWMMWNWLVSALAAGSPIVLYDGAPMPPGEADLLWRLADEGDVAVFGTSAKYLALAEKVGLEPHGGGRGLRRLRAVLSTGSPLAPESFDWIGRALGPGIQTASISGGTDIVSCFVLGNPLDPVHRGEIQGPGLGMAVEVFDEEGHRQEVGEAGELVCTVAFPSMPVGFWGDPDQSRYREAYFSVYPGVWRHGDWTTRTPSGGFVISGRSDATLNPGGVRIGTAEIYRQVEAIDEVLESLVIGQRIPGGSDGDVRVVLFVRLREPGGLDEALRDAIRRRIRAGTSPHHVPRVILEVTDIPRTRSGKLSEIAVGRVVEGREVRNVGALANPEALEQFRGRPELAEG